MSWKRREIWTAHHRLSGNIQVWVALIGAMAVVVAGVFTAYITGYFSRQPKVETQVPRFITKQPVINPFHRPLILYADNKLACRKEPLDVKFGKLIYQARAIPHKDSQIFSWEIAFHEFLGADKLQSGAHEIQVKFPGEKFMGNITIEFYNEAPIVDSKLESLSDSPQTKLLRGKTFSKRQDPEEWMQIEIFFHQEGQPIHIPLPVKRVIDEQTQRVHFEFESHIENIPNIPADDPRYGAPFFAFQATDEAGNTYYNVFSYAQFIAPGENRFGVGNVADIAFHKLEEPTTGKAILDFRLTPNPQTIGHLYQGPRALSLTVHSYAENINKLQWTKLPEEIRAVQPLTLVYRNQQQLTISFSHIFTDDGAPQGQNIAYQVMQTGRGGRIYASNVVESPFPPAEKPPPKRYQLHVQATPEDSTITLRNSEFTYVPGVKLPLGRYDIEVTRKGYKTTRLSAVIKNQDVTRAVYLERETREAEVKRYKLTVRPTPGDSTIKIMNIKPKYRPGIALAPGTYRILVEKDGYEARHEVVMITDADVSIAITLQGSQDLAEKQRTAKLRSRTTQGMIPQEPKQSRKAGSDPIANDHRLYRLAIFPWKLQKDAHLHTDVIDSAMNESIKESKLFHIIFSYHQRNKYSNDISSIISQNIKSIWYKKNMLSNYEPNINIIRNIGEKLKIDAVLMYNIEMAFGVGAQDTMQVFLVDLRRLKIYTDQGYTNDFVLDSEGFNEVKSITTKVINEYRKHSSQ